MRSSRVFRRVSILATTSGTTSGTSTTTKTLTCPKCAEFLLVGALVQDLLRQGDGRIRPVDVILHVGDGFSDHLEGLRRVLTLSNDGMQSIE